MRIGPPTGTSLVLHPLLMPVLFPQHSGNFSFCRKEISFYNYLIICIIQYGIFHPDDLQQESRMGDRRVLIGFVFSYRDGFQFFSERDPEMAAGRFRNISMA